MNYANEYMLQCMHMFCSIRIYTFHILIYPILFQHIHHSTDFNLKFSHSE